MARWKNEIPSWSKRHWEVLDFEAGLALNSTEIKNLERILEQTPDDLEVRILLLAQYSHARMFRRRKERVAEAQQKFLSHLKWLITKHPAHNEINNATFLMKCEPGFDEIRDLWEQTIRDNPENVDVLFGASYFFWLEHSERSEEICKQILQVEPNYIDAYFRLCRIYEFRVNDNLSRSEKMDLTRKAIEHFRLGWQILLANTDETSSSSWRINPHEFTSLIELAEKCELSEELRWLVETRKFMIEQIKSRPDFWRKSQPSPGSEGTASEGPASKGG